MLNPIDEPTTARLRALRCLYSEAVARHALFSEHEQAVLAMHLAGRTLKEIGRVLDRTPVAIHDAKARMAKKTGGMPVDQLAAEVAEMKVMRMRIAVLELHEKMSQPTPPDINELRILALSASMA